MNKKDMIDAVANETGVSKTDAEKVYDSVFDQIATAMKNGSEVRVQNFGTFSVTQRQARTGRNPQTGEAVQIAASSAPKFKPAKGLKDALN